MDKTNLKMTDINVVTVQGVFVTGPETKKEETKKEVEVEDVRDDVKEEVDEEWGPNDIY